MYFGVTIAPKQKCKHRDCIKHDATYMKWTKYEENVELQKQILLCKCKFALKNFFGCIPSWSSFRSFSASSWRTDFWVLRTATYISKSVRHDFSASRTWLSSFTWELTKHMFQTSFFIKVKAPINRGLHTTFKPHLTFFMFENKMAWSSTTFQLYSRDGHWLIDF